ncbi:MAG: tetratricopeptide repeat protein [Desulfobacterales bacterium]|nr:tetratricopeptide repeat protein [Desulfobacterales bacterium]
MSSRIPACEIRRGGQGASQRIHFTGPGPKRGRGGSDFGRWARQKSDPVDHAVGFVIHKKVGDKVEKGDALFTVHANDEAKLAEAREAVLAAHSFSDEEVSPLPLFYYMKRCVIIANQEQSDSWQKFLFGRITVRSSAMIDRSHLDEAVAHCQHILKTFPKHLETYRLLGKAYLEARRHNEAVDIFTRVLAAEPNDFVAHVGMSIIRDEQNKLDDAIWHMERAFEVQSANPAIQAELQRLYGRRDGIQPPRIRMTRGALAHMYVRGELYPQAIIRNKGRSRGGSGAQRHAGPAREGVLPQRAKEGRRRCRHPLF